MNIQLFLVWTEGSFWLRNGPSRNSSMFSSRRSAKCPGQGSEDFSGILYSMVKKITFLEGNLCMYKCFTNVL